MKPNLHIWDYVKGHPVKSFLVALPPIALVIVEAILGEEVKKCVIGTAKYWLSDVRTLQILSVVLVVFVVGTFVVFGGLNKSLQKALNKREVEELHRKRLVLFVSPDLEGFYGEYLIHLVRAAQEQADHEIDFAILPYHHRDGTCTPELVLSSLCTQLKFGGRLIDGVFIIPKAPHEPKNKQELMKFESNPKAPPLVTLDVYPAAEEVEGYPCFVGGNEQVGGELAAMKAHDLLRGREQTSKLQVLVLVGSNSDWERQRVTSFEDTLGKFWPNPQLEIDKTDELHYDEHKARTKLMEMHNQFQLANAGFLHPLSYHLIFACSDAMALGAAKAIQDIRRDPPPQVADNGVIILGYDGTKRMESTLDLGHPLLKSTVCVDIKKQAECAVAVMKRLIQGRNKSEPRVNPEALAQPERFMRIDPKLWMASR